MRGEVIRKAFLSPSMFFSPISLQKQQKKHTSPDEVLLVRVLGVRHGRPLISCYCCCCCSATDASAVAVAVAVAAAVAGCGARNGRNICAAVGRT